MGLARCEEQVLERIERRYEGDIGGQHFMTSGMELDKSKE